jgi:hypothetical protein
VRKAGEAKRVLKYIRSTSGHYEINGVCCPSKETDDRYIEGSSLIILQHKWRSGFDERSSY